MAAQFKFLSGFESTHIFGSGRDVLQTTRHTEFFCEDLGLVQSCGLGTMRYSAPWHTIERESGVYDWTWLDKSLNCLRGRGIEPILDPLHHTSFPEWMKGGFANPKFPELYLGFVTKLAERYPWVKYYTVINEPFVTMLLCGHEGIWYPFKRGAKNFVPMIIHAGEAICQITQMLIEKLPEVCFIHVDTCEKHRALDSESETDAEFRNEFRFLVHDLVLGKINETHPLYFYLLKNGASVEKLNWFIENPARIDVLGLDYYAHSELEWRVTGRVYPNEQPVGFAAVALEYIDRYNLPAMLSETNIRGLVSDRVSWLKFMVEQCEILQTQLEPRQIAFEGFCWYPFIDSTDWDSLVREANGRVDPQGIYWLDNECQNRYASELSEMFAALACGAITSKDIPAYHFQHPLDEGLRAFLPLMADWKWKTPGI